MLTASAQRSVPDTGHRRVYGLNDLRADGWSDRAIRSQLAAHRWVRVGRAIVLHNGTPTRDDRARVALINHGPRAVLTSFSATQEFGLTGWERDETHVLVPGGARVIPSADTCTHWSGDWAEVERHPLRPLQSLGPALTIAASSFANERPACGILAAAVQQRLIRPGELRRSLERAPRSRHRALLLHAVDDIAQGAHALSEIDLARLCRRHGLPPPTRQAVRLERSGRRRYLDAEWIRPDGQRVGVEVDGAIHLAVSRWVNDQLRQNELVIGGDLVLRYPSVLIRIDDPIVADQLRRALLPS